MSRIGGRGAVAQPQAFRAAGPARPVGIAAFGSRHQAAAQRIQSAHRGKLVRAQLGQLKQLHHELVDLYASQIQAVIRGKLVRARLGDGAPNATHRAVAAPNALPRPHQNRRQQAQAQTTPPPVLLASKPHAPAAQPDAASRRTPPGLRPDDAAVRVQARARGRRARDERRALQRRAGEEREARARSQAAQRIQTAKRGADARSLARRHRRERDEARAQADAAAARARAESNAAAVRVQQSYRGAAGRRSAAELRAARAEAARRSSAERSAASAIQARARGRAARRALVRSGAEARGVGRAGGAALAAAAGRQPALRASRDATVRGAMAARRHALARGERDDEGKALAHSGHGGLATSATSAAARVRDSGWAFGGARGEESESSSLGLSGEVIYVPALAIRHPHLYTQRRRTAAASSAPSLSASHPREWVTGTGSLSREYVGANDGEHGPPSCFNSPGHVHPPHSPPLSTFGGAPADGWRAGSAASHARGEAGDGLRALLALQGAQAEIAASLPVRDAVRVEHLLRRKDDAMLSYLRERIAFDSAREQLGMLDTNGHPATELRAAAPLRAELDILGAHVEAQRRHYAQALEALSLEAAVVLPADELQRLHDVHAELERAMRASLRNHEAARPSHHARARANGGAAEWSAEALARGGGAGGDVDSAVCTVQ